MKRAIIIHCWDGYPEYCWYPKTKKELEALGFKVSVPAMPETETPKLFLWLPKLQEVIGVPDEDLYLIGHSVGCVTIMRYLESLSDQQKVGGIVLVAGFTDDLGFEELKNFFETPMDFKKIRSRTKHVALIHSDDDPYVLLRYGEELNKKLNACDYIVKRGMKHFSGPQDKEDGCLSLPDVVDLINKMDQAG